MINYTPVLYGLLSALSTPSQYETFEVPADVPLITFYQLNNSDGKRGDTIAYSNLSYSIKVWANSIGECEDILSEVDDIMHTAGFTRGACVDFNDHGYNTKIVNYYATGYEK